MSFGILSGLKPSEEEKKKRRGQFNSNIDKYSNIDRFGFGSNLSQSSPLAQKIQKQKSQGLLQPTPAQNQMRVAAQAQQQTRTQGLNEAKATREREYGEAITNARAVAKLPVKEQQQAITEMRQPNVTPPQPMAVPSSPPKSANNVMQAGAGVMQQPSSQASNQRYPVSPEAKSSMQNQLQGMGINANNPYVQGRPKEQWNPKDYPSVYAGKPNEPQAEQQPIQESYVAPPPQQLGFNPAGASNNSAVPTQQSNGGFRAPNAPTTRSWGERQEYEALMRQATTVQKGANGITAAQMNIQAGLQNNSDKAKNDRYTAQLGAASQLAQAQMSQDGANSRATQSEAGSNDRLNSQLGFDAQKFQQTAMQQQQVTANDSRRLDMQQANDDVSNYAPKQLNNLYDKYEAANGEWEKSDIAKQIQALKGSSSDKEYWTNIGGGETATADGLGSTKNPDVLLNRNTGEIKRQPAVEIDFSTDERAQAIINNTKLSKEEREKQLNALR